jgi:hypothetical protein
MGIAGHILGPKKLRALNRLTGRSLSRAYRRNWYAEGVEWSPAGTHVHVAIDPLTGICHEIANPMHWSSCDQAPRA